MKRFLLIVIATIAIVACKDEERRTLYEDMIYFAENPSSVGGYITPLTQLDAKPMFQLELLIWRNAFAAKDHPKQHVQVIVDQKLTTAELGRDFSISESSLTFNGENNTSIPITINIHDAKGKTIVLQLAYEYYQECPAEGRKADHLKIQIK